jgi:hypothetical protein
MSAAILFTLWLFSTVVFLWRIERIEESMRQLRAEKSR